MCQPEGFEDSTGRVCHLIKTLYGLKQAGREWNAKFNCKMQLRGFKRLRSDPCVYTRSKDIENAIITIWVNNLLLFTNSAATMLKMKKDIQDEWETTDMEEPSKIIGIEITLSKGSISISQKQSIKKILERQGLDTVSPILMPLNPNIKLVSNPDGNKGDRSNSFMQLLGELQYIAISMHPNITFAVN